MSHQNVFGMKFLQDTLWPIFPHEVKRILPLSFLLFLVCFNYSMLRCMKDTVVVTASSAAVIPFIKVWTLLPMAVIFTFFYAKISSWFSRQTVFYLIVSAFLAFFLVFSFLLYPHSENFHLTNSANWLKTVLPVGMSGFIAMIEYWSFTLFYIIAELWSNIVLSILTWGFINEITNLKEAPRFYTVLSVASNVAAIAAGVCANVFVSGSLRHDWQQSQQYMILTIVVSGILTMLLYRYLNARLDQDRRNDSQEGFAHDRLKFSLSESMREVRKSKHLFYLAVIVVAYFFVMNTVEVIWKEQLRLLYPTPTDFSFYMNTLTTWIGIVSTCLGIFVGILISRFGWTKTAMLTPMVMLVTSLLFFVFVVFQNDLAAITSLVGTSPLVVAVFIGGLQNCLSKGAKYSVFDATKEMAFIPLSKMSKIRGKAVIDGIMSRVGKSGASLALQSTILMFGGLLLSTPYITGIMLAVIVGWIYSTRSLGRIIDGAITHEAVDPSPVEDLPSTNPRPENALPATP